MDKTGGHWMSKQTLKKRAGGKVIHGKPRPHAVGGVQAGNICSRGTPFYPHSINIASIPRGGGVLATTKAGPFRVPGESPPSP